MTVYAPPGQPGSPATVQDRYDNWIGGEFVAPVDGKYFENPSPVTGQVYCEVARSTAADVELALDGGHPFAADPVLVAVLERDLRTLGAGLGVNSHC